MLETPLFGRFQGENKRLVFSAPTPYHVLIRSVGVLGAGMIVFPVVGPILGQDVPLYSGWWVFTGMMLVGAAALAAMSLQSIAFNLRERMYKRRQGPGMFPTASYGSFDKLDALVLIAEPHSRMVQNGVTYHLVLHWKGQQEPSMVVQQDSRQLRQGEPLNAASIHLLQAGTSYARALGIPFYDNSHFASPCPVRILA